MIFSSSVQYAYCRYVGTKLEMNVCPKMYSMSGSLWSKLHEADVEVAANHSLTQYWQDNLLAL